MTREEALEVMWKNLPSNKSLPVYEALQTLIPELRESEEERIRKRISLCLDECVHSDIIRDYERDECLAYLEKQKEQKPVISDEAIQDGVIHFGITQYQIDNWLKKHINVIEQKPVEWDEEDEVMLNAAI